MNLQLDSALPAARHLLRVLTVLNWLLGAAILGLLVGTVVNPDWTMRALGQFPADVAARMLLPLQLVAALGLVGVPLNGVVLGRLRDIVDTVRQGDPFVRGNADRLQAIGWALLVLQLLGGVIWIIGEAASGPGHRLDLGAGFSAAGWLAVLLSFVLARVFAEGSHLRDEIEGVV